MARLGRPRVLIAMAAATLVVIALGALLVRVVADDEPAAATYTAATRAAFLSACTARGGDPVEPECVCFYDAIRAEVPYERYRSVSARLLATPPTGNADLDLPDDFQSLLGACRRAAPLPGS